MRRGEEDEQEEEEDTQEYEYLRQANDIGGVSDVIVR